MFGKILTPDSVRNADLDTYLDKGWFRMGQAVFTCNVLNFDRTFYSAIWLRLRLDQYADDPTFRKLQKLNAAFRIEIQPATITPAKEDLYSRYKSGIAFETASSLASLLLEPAEHSIFDTYEVCMYDEDKLIAVGYFDIGEKSAAGIVSFYDPEYKKYSLGKYLIYTKIAYCARQGFSYFYPGYFTPNYPMFDYKLTIGKPALAFFDLNTQQWLTYSSFTASNVPLLEHGNKLTEMEKALVAHDIPYFRLKYEFYNANTILHLKELDLFDYPEFIMVFSPAHSGFVPIIIYDVIAHQYRLVRCISCFHDENYVSTDNYYGTHLMKIAEELFASADAHLITECFVMAEDQ